MSSALKLPPTPLLLPGAVLAAATLLLITTLLLQGRALRDSSLAIAPATLGQSVATNHDAPLPATRAGPEIGVLANSELFGHYDPTAEAAASAASAPDKAAAVALGDKAPDALPEAALALKLQGIVFKKDPAQRRAIIAGDGPNAEARKIGESLPGDAVIRFIEARRVVVEQQGELKALSLPEAALGANAASYGQGAPEAPIGVPNYGAPTPPVYQHAEPQYEPPPEDMDTDAAADEPPAPQDYSEQDQSEPTE